MREFEIYWLALGLTVVVLWRDRRAAALAPRPRADRDPRQRTGGAEQRHRRVAASSWSSIVLTAFGTAMVGALIFLQKLRISPDTAFSVNDWTAFVIFITVIGGIGTDRGADHRHDHLLRCCGRRWPTSAASTC